MRVSDRLVFQSIDDGLYVLADEVGNEIRLDAEEVARWHVGIGVAFVNRDRFLTDALARVRRFVQAAQGRQHPCRGCGKMPGEHPHPDCEGWY